MSELEEIEKKAEIETLKELKKRKASAKGKEKASKKVKQDQLNEEKKKRIEQLLGFGREELISYSSKLGFKKIQWKTEDKKRETKDIAHLVFYKEQELGGKDQAASIAMNEANRVEALRQQKELKKAQVAKGESAQLRALRSEIEELRNEISKIKK